MSYTDWIPNFEKLEDKHDKVILELGCGLGTKYLVDNFKKVYSYEVTTSPYWYNKTKEDLNKYSNWESIFYYDKYIKEYDNKIVSSRGITRETMPLKRYFKQLHNFVNVRDLDIVFVDQGNHFRAESAMYFMSWGIPLVIIHDSKKFPTNTDKLYGYDKIKCEDYNYWYVAFTTGQGTTMFFNKDYYPQK
jgi:hypothetical protein